MNRHLFLIGSILRKDLLSLWPLLLFVFLLQALWTFDDSLHFAFMSLFIRAALPQIVQLVSVVLVLAVVHLDAAASVRHDWLTRPIPRSDLVISKAVFILIATALPVALAGLIGNLLTGHSFMESLVQATTIERTMMVVIALALIAIAFLTATFVEAIVAIAILFVILMFIPVLALRVSGVGEEIIYLGSGWVLLNVDGLIILVAICVAGWLQYGRRKTTLARSVFVAGMVVVAASPAPLTWNRIFSIQRAVATNQAAADTLKIELTPGCFPATLLNPFPIDKEEVLAQDSEFDANWRRAAGRNAIRFTSAAIPSGAAKDWKVMISRVSATYRRENDEVVHSLRPARFTPNWKPTTDGALAANHSWLLSRDTYLRLVSQPSHLQLDYSLNLLEPRSMELPIDGARKYFPEFGYCGAKFTESMDVTVSCFKHGEQPALVTAELVGATEKNTIDDFPDYTPSWLEFFGGKRYGFTLHQQRGSNATRVKITAFEARAHVDRQLSIPGVLGGPVNNCPAPAAE